MKKSTLTLVAFLAACGSGSSEKKDGPQAEVTQPALPTHPDIGPTQQIDLTLPSISDAGTRQIEARAQYCTRTHCYVGLVSGAVDPQWKLAPGSAPHAVWTPNIVRVVGGTMPASLTTRYAAVPYMMGLQVATEQGRLVVDTSQKLPLDGALEKQFWDELAESMGRHGQGMAFSQFASTRAQSLGGAPQAAANRNTEFHDLMSLYTGMTSVQEALQYDRTLLLTDVRQKADIDLASIPGVPLPVHPWDQMITELGASPVVEPLASVIPRDMAYVHFSDLRDFVSMARDLDDWITPAVQMLEISPGPSHFTEKYEQTLIVERTGLAEALGHVATDGVALTTSDPFLREGSDVSLVFKVRNRAALVTALTQFETHAKARRPDVQEAFWKDGDVVVRRVFTPDGTLEQNRVELGDVLIISNSRGAIREFIAAHRGTSPRLADEGDFRYMRARYPYTKSETGFIFLSDAFVARAVSPEVKILEARRMRAQADQAVLEYATLFYGMLEGTSPSSLQDVVQAGYLDKAHLKHFDGQPIRFDLDNGASSAWGTSRLLTPIRDLNVGKVTAAERDAYVRFRDTYQQYWRAFIDPIGVQIAKNGDAGWHLDGRMLPLIQNSEYDELIELVGATRVTPVASQSGAQLVFAIGQNARLRKELDGMSRTIMPGSDVQFGWLGDWVTVGLEDRSGLWDMMVATGTVRGVGDNNGSQQAMMAAVARLPFYVGAHVVNSVAFGGFMATLKGFVMSAAPGMLDWNEVPHYRDIPVVRVGTRPGAPEGDIAVFYAVHDGNFVASTERVTLEVQLDRILDKQWPAPATAADSDTQAQLGIELGDSWIATSALAMTDHFIQMEHARSARAYEELVYGLPGRIQSDEDLKRLGIVYLGLEPRSPHGGVFSVLDGWANHTVYGSILAPRLSELPIKDSDLTRAIRKTSRLEGALDFEGEGNHKGLRVRFELER